MTRRVSEKMKSNKTGLKVSHETANMGLTPKMGDAIPRNSLGEETADEHAGSFSRESRSLNAPERPITGNGLPDNVHSARVLTRLGGLQPHL